MLEGKKKLKKDETNATMEYHFSSKHDCQVKLLALSRVRERHERQPNERVRLKIEEANKLIPALISVHCSLWAARASAGV
jgi:hypothetical protein